MSKLRHNNNSNFYFLYKTQNRISTILSPGTLLHLKNFFLLFIAKFSVEIRTLKIKNPIFGQTKLDNFKGQIGTVNKNGKVTNQLK